MKSPTFMNDIRPGEYVIDTNGYVHRAAELSTSVPTNNQSTMTDPEYQEYRIELLEAKIDAIVRVMDQAILRSAIEEIDELSLKTS